jgi:drug/metabolite transporter (DMT)-like permease
MSLLAKSNAVAQPGLLLGALAVVFWSFGSSLIYLGAREVGTWRFVAIASLTGGVLQMISRRIQCGELRTALCLPWRLWVAPVLCFVLYGLAWPWALAISSPRQVYGVSLINYLWPVLTVLFSVAWVPGMRLKPRMVLALVLALAGLGAANLPHLGQLLPAAGEPGSSVLRRWLPYGLALVAAVTWAVYSALLVRWRYWAGKYITSPIGFVLIGLIASGVMGLNPDSQANHSQIGTWLTVFYGIGPLAAGYLLWELALARGNIHALSLVAAATPVLSTLLLCCFLRTWPGPELVLAAFLVGGGVALSLGE